MSGKTPTKIFERKESINSTNDIANVSNRNIQDKTKEKLFLSFLLMFEIVIVPTALKMLYVRCKSTKEHIDITNLYVRVRKKVLPFVTKLYMDFSISCSSYTNQYSLVGDLAFLVLQLLWSGCPKKSRLQTWYWRSVGYTQEYLQHSDEWFHLN